MFFYTYVLQNAENKSIYVGYTSNLKRRLEEHETNHLFTNKFRQPFKLIYYEACIKMVDAKRREKYFKTTQGKRFLTIRLNEYKRTE
ncbi:MAG: excinuclease ABC subunit C [Candidatus Doudnabacteria bacterium RIFCSPHIGHO2_02_FULL_46_11]|uniref:Excinuclease ABC subunit C n=1 Tax=Candidatus Doudnabacteria bacterium RIFCSPHIGHO2_02_FULL_46_11 TaxID=1817832 RepID=A0A1F5PA39_9BACT|nr:MAG: excinuclease ABC subunit C [Candidatus Doudnabacteria bacterium RIFCSPHIGHO2_02_FULL_46_11]